MRQLHVGIPKGEAFIAVWNAAGKPTDFPPGRLKRQAEMLRRCILR